MLSRARRGWARFAVRAGRWAGRVSRRVGSGCRFDHRGSGHPVAGSGGADRARGRPSGGAGVGHERQDHDQSSAGRGVAHHRWPVAHNASGSNMADGAVAALAEARDARYAVLEVDEWHLAAVARAVRSGRGGAAQPDPGPAGPGHRGARGRGRLGAALAEHPRTLVVANADDPMVVWAASDGITGVLGGGRRRLARRYGDLPAMREHPARRRSGLEMRLRAGPTTAGLVARPVDLLATEGSVDPAGVAAPGPVQHQQRRARRGRRGRAGCPAAAGRGGDG